MKKRCLSNEVLYNTASKSDDNMDMEMEAEIRKTLAGKTSVAGACMLATALSNKPGRSQRKSEETMLQEDLQEVWFQRPSMS